MKNTVSREVAAQVARTKLTEGQEDVLRVVTLKGHLSIGEAADRMQDVQVLLSDGYLRLATVIYSWGLDFELEPTNYGRSRNGGLGP